MMRGQAAIAEKAQWEGVVVLVVAPTPSHPQDYGNRKRIFRICQTLKEAGARLHYLHYPAEVEWRGKLPLSAQRAMMQAWDGYYMAVPTRALHPAPVGCHHKIDEWWDPNIEVMMRWLCDALNPAVVIANYTWMSKCLEYAPQGALKILDTHDRFSGRKEVLASIGVMPEFFYTTEEEEVKALTRADIVWAIKPQEKIAFEKICDRPVLTMPHVDPYDPIKDTPVQECPDDRELRIGLVGAGNHVNAANFQNFFRIAAPIFKASLAPLKLVVGGTICTHLEDTDVPFIRKYGLIDDIENFYADIDVAVVPMESSTGLKIKIAEALSFGVPVIAHAHAFEGYAPYHPFQVRESLEAIAEACVDVACDPEKYLDDMRFASLQSHRDTADVMTDTFRATGRKVFGQGKFTLICAHEDISLQGSLYRSLVSGCFEYLGNRSPIMLFIDAVSDIGGLLRFCRTSPVPMVFLNPLVLKSLSEKEIFQLRDAGAVFASLDHIMRRFEISQIWFDKIPELAPIRPLGTAGRVYVNLAYAATGAGPPSDMVAMLQPYLGPFTEVSVLSADHVPIATALCSEIEAEFLKVPSFWLRKCDLAWSLEARPEQAAFGVNLILPSAAGNEALVSLVSDILKSSGQPLMNLIEVDRRSGVLKRQYLHGCDYRFFSREALNSSSRTLLREAALTVNFAPHDPFAVMLCSLFDAALHDTITPTENEMRGLDDVTGGMTLMRFIDVVSSTLRQRQASRSRAQVLAVQREIDPGWTHVWHQRDVDAERPMHL